ncbi:MAG TPA: acyltransferase [Polyangiaceae bacterium]|nr:acyltransferase [Polyangiaceae bacterium]
MTVRANANPDAPFVHPTATIDADVVIGDEACVWHHCHVMSGARLGRGVMLGQGCYVGRGVTIGDRTRIQNHVSVFEGVELESDVFVGPSAVFTNVLRPRAFLKQEFLKTRVRRGATIGANATILPGIEVGEYAFVGAASLVRKDVPRHALVVGVPARRIGWVGTHGERLRFDGNLGVCPLTGERYRLTPEGLTRDEPAEP